MSITLNTLAYSQDVSLNSNKMLYVGPDNSFSVKDHLTLGRTSPKPTTTFAGVARAEAKRTKTVTLGDGSTAEAIVTITTSLPVGMAEADADDLRDDVGDFAISADCKTLFWNHDLTY
jgi:hypothetical protein